jgi:hypothetical protein
MSKAPKPDEKPDPLKDTKATAPTEIPEVMSAFAAADLWGVWFGTPPGRSTRKNRPPYSLM